MHTNQLVQLGDRVRIRYTRIRDDGAGSGGPRRSRELEFTVGTSGMIPSISLGVVGMVQGQHKRFKLQPREAYGVVKPQLIREIPRGRFPKHLVLKVGKRLTAVQGIAGPRRRVTVVEIRPNSVVVDGNHPLAGKAVVLEITVISVDSSPNANAGKPQFDVGGES